MDYSTLKHLRKLYQLQYVEWQNGPDFDENKCDEIDPSGNPINEFQDCMCRYCKLVPIRKTVELPDDFSFEEMSENRFRDKLVIKKQRTLKSEMIDEADQHRINEKSW